MTASRPLSLAASPPDGTASTAPSTNDGPAKPPIGNALTEEQYLSGREAALKWARENGFNEESLVELPVAWGEQDANNHVNNAVYFKWLESGRLQYLNALGDHLDPADAKDLRGAGKGKGPILARITFDYRKPTFYPDNVLVAHKPLQVSAKKMVTHAAVYSYAQQGVVGTSDSVTVSFDYDVGKSCAWPAAFIDLLVERGAERLEASASQAKL
ncbi:hypothetical protein JCM3770_004130 [Rhodotorula araucariae]